MTTKSITVEKEFGSGDNKRTVSKTGSCVVAETAEDILTLLQEDEKNPVAKDASEAELKRVRMRVIVYFNYASDLKERARLNGQIASENVDPDKAAEKGFEQYNRTRAANGLKAVTFERFLEKMRED